MGCHALLMAQLAGETGRVIAFEPMSAAYARLQRNIGLNHFSNIVAEQVGLSDSASQAEIAFAASWRLDLKPGKVSVEKVSFETLDGYAAAHPELFHRLDCIKLDVDGFEDLVLRGAEDTLQRHHPAILMEIGRDSLGAVRYLQAQNYSFFTEAGTEIRPDSITMPLTPGRRPTVNVIALPTRADLPPEQNP